MARRSIAGPALRPRRVIGVLVAAAALVILLPAAPASAHAFLTDSNPADGAVYTSAPRTLRLEFSESVVIAATRIDIVDSSGHHYAPRAMRLVHSGSADSTEEPAQVVSDLPPLPRSAYRVNWATLVQRRSASHQRPARLRGEPTGHRVGIHRADSTAGRGRAALVALPRYRRRAGWAARRVALPQPRRRVRATRGRPLRLDLGRRCRRGAVVFRCTSRGSTPGELAICRACAHQLLRRTLGRARGRPARAALRGAPGSAVRAEAHIGEPVRGGWGRLRMSRDGDARTHRSPDRVRVDRHGGRRVAPGCCSHVVGHAARRGSRSAAAPACGRHAGRERPRGPARLRGARRVVRQRHGRHRHLPRQWCGRFC